MRKAGADQGRQKLSYEELSRLCEELQDQVARGIMVQQQLNSMKTELDRELNRFKIIQEFSQEGLFQDRIEDFANLATEYFIQAFEQPHCLLAECQTEAEAPSIIGRFGLAGISLPSTLNLGQGHFDSREGFLLSQRPQLAEPLSELGFDDALLAPMFRPDNQFCGFIICGQRPEDRRFYDPINPKDRHAFTLMATKASYLLHNFRTNELLKQEIKERRRVEKALEEKAEDLLRSNAELEQFAYVVSHDLKAPLRNITGFADQLLGHHREELSESSREYLDIIVEEVGRFSGIIDALLQYARVSSSSAQDFATVDFGQVAEQVKGQLSLLLDQQGAEILVSNLPCLDANQRQMQQLFQNLIVNALKFTQPGCPPRIHIFAEPLQAGGYRFAIRDNGMGLAEEDRNRIFLLFKRGRYATQYEGSGLGLSICKKIVEQHQVKIWAESEGPGKGTTFFFTLPGGKAH